MYKFAYKRYNLKPTSQHFYSVFIYAIALSVFFTEYKKPYIIFCIFLFILAKLSTFWHNKILLFQNYSENNNGKFIFYQNLISEVFKIDDKSEIEFFESGRQRFLIEDKIVRKLENKMTYTCQQLMNGITVHNYQYYPPNEFKVPEPDFVTLFKEQCVTPLFCFQILSSLLMCLDDHLWNGILSICLIVFLEGSQVFNRVVSMKIFRKLEHKPSQVTRIARGDGKIIKETVSSTSLKPGDKIIINSLIDIPCDMIILDGSCAVNEAMLSGESVPLFREDIFTAGNNKEDVVDFNKKKNSVLFAGTKLEKIYSRLTCLVYRTSFNTEKGALLSKMMVSDDIKYDQEALGFILLISLISLINSFFTYKYSTKKGYKLFLDIIILFTSSIPFELPMEMGLAIQSAVKNLIKKKIYCLEPFRITLAGKVEIACFDKTGTLTDSNLEVKKIEYKTKDTSKILSCCHNLISVEEKGTVIYKGDPLELAIHNYGFEKIAYKVIKTFPFESQLRRQGVIAEFSGRMFYCLKGAPEEIEKYLENVPDKYEDYKKYSSEGYRVIALAIREINIQDIKLFERSNEKYFEDRKNYECKMVFSGFILLGCSLRKDAVEMINILQKAGINVIMITGDNLLTALNIAKQVKIRGPGIEGKEIESILKDNKFMEYKVFGRTDPIHKEMIINRYKELGFKTMMVGDGTNDVGALKAADVGVAMLESSVTESKSIVDDLKTVEPGDASIAAPFSIRANSMLSVVEIIQQGRSSLVTTIQMYKILALNSVINAFFTMAVDIINLKFSDPQMISIGVLSSIGFSAITSSKSLSEISKVKPVTSIFNIYVLTSILGQSFIQLVGLFILCKHVPYKPVGDVFSPSVLNTVLYLFSCVQTISVFICNYIGRPFRENLIENKILMMSIVGMVGFAANVVLRFNDEINEIIQVVDIQSCIVLTTTVLTSILVISFAFERMCRWMFLQGSK